MDFITSVSELRFRYTQALIMVRSFRLVFVLTILLADSSGAAQVGTPTLVSIQTPRGATQTFILMKVDNPVASVILFGGGYGLLGLKSASSIEYGEGFLVRSRAKFADHHFMVAVVDAPSDQQQGMNAMFRMSGAHAGDIGAVAAYLKEQAGVPVWLVGTSMGTFSAAHGAIAAQGIDGLVLTSTVTRVMEGTIARSHPDGVASMALPEITVPTLIVSHRKDACKTTPAADAPKLSKRLAKASKVEIALLDGGDPPLSDDPCGVKAPHGYFGIEAEAVDTIAKFISDNSK